MPGQRQHAYLTRCALDLMPGKFQLPAPIRAAMLDEYCMYPDRFLTSDRDTYEALLPYMFIDEGIQFHYPPDTPLSELYRYWMPDTYKARIFKSRTFQNLISSTSKGLRVLSHADYPSFPPGRLA